MTPRYSRPPRARRSLVFLQLGITAVGLSLLLFGRSLRDNYWAAAAQTVAISLVIFVPLLIAQRRIEGQVNAARAEILQTELGFKPLNTLGQTQDAEAAGAADQLENALTWENIGRRFVSERGLGASPASRL